MSLQFRFPSPASSDDGRQPQDRSSKGAPPPPDWLMVTLVVCVVLVLSGLSLLSGRRNAAAEDLPSPAPAITAAPTPKPTPSSEPASTPQPSYDWTQPVPEGESADPETWFQDAVFIGDSRVEGLHSFSGIKGGEFLTYTGLTIYEVDNGKEVIRQGDKKLPLLEALSRKSCGKIYIALGINELGYFDADGFAETYGRVIDKLRECQPDAAIYVQAIIPVNTAKCGTNNQPYYITNEAIRSYNEALAAMAGEKKVFLLDVPQSLIDEDGEALADYSSDGVHFKKEGYVVWLEDLLRHTADPDSI